MYIRKSGSFTLQFLATIIIGVSYGFKVELPGFSQLNKVSSGLGNVPGLSKVNKLSAEVNKVKAKLDVVFQLEKLFNQGRYR